MDIKKEKEVDNEKKNKTDIEGKEKEDPRNEENKGSNVQVIKEIINYQYSNNGVNYII